MLLERKAQRQRICTECMVKIAAVGRTTGRGGQGFPGAGQRQGGEWLNERG
jgi:hypothetical protein